jgi:hypothetical protein
MFTIKISGMDELRSALLGMERQIPYAIANALNATARWVKDEEQREIMRKFDRPTPFTLNSLQLTPAKAPKGPMIATVWFRDPPNLGTKDHYLLPQIEGGSRPVKNYEMGLGGRFTMPGKGLLLDKWGNIGRGNLTRILSQSGSFRESGFSMNMTRGRRNKVGDLFMLKARRGKLLPGIYERTQGKAGGRIGRYLLARGLGAKKRELNARYKSMYPQGIKPILIFPTKAPTYRKRFDFYGVAQKVVTENLGPELRKAIDLEISREMAYRARHGR